MKMTDEVKYVIDTCDQCCGYYPIIKSEPNYIIYCRSCGNGVESDKLWKAVTYWNIMVRKAEVGKKDCSVNE